MPEARIGAQVVAINTLPVDIDRRVKQSLRELGVPDAQVHYEFFGPAEALA